MKAFVFTIIFLTPLFCFSQDKKDSLPKVFIDIDRLIDQKEDDIKQRSFLLSFKKTYEKNNKLTVLEYKSHYEIIVTHSEKDNYTGGAEAYKLDKETGKSEMIWHEHPMKIEIIDEEEK